MDYLYELVHDNRAGNRSGFPLEVVEEIALLMRTLENGYGLRRRG
jgi:pilus assembly protein FimV